MTTHTCRYVYSFESLRGSSKHTQYEATHTHTHVCMQLVEGVDKQGPPTAALWSLNVSKQPYLHVLIDGI